MDDNQNLQLTTNYDITKEASRLLVLNQVSLTYKELEPQFKNNNMNLYGELLTELTNILDIFDNINTHTLLTSSGMTALYSSIGENNSVDMFINLLLEYKSYLNLLGYTDTEIEKNAGMLDTFSKVSYFGTEIQEMLATVTKNNMDDINKSKPEAMYRGLLLLLKLHTRYMKDIILTLTISNRSHNGNE